MRRQLEIQHQQLALHKRSLINNYSRCDASFFLQMFFLSFCRGKLPGNTRKKVNRTKNSWECKPETLKEWLEDSSFSPIQVELSEERKKMEWHRNPFPDIDVPVNSYVIFSTLPDSKYV